MEFVTEPVQERTLNQSRLRECCICSGVQKGNHLNTAKISFPVQVIYTSPTVLGVLFCHVFLNVQPHHSVFMSHQMVLLQQQTNTDYVKLRGLLRSTFENWKVS